jgi:hypothetical protein
MTPAKKATPAKAARSTSLSDLLGNDEVKDEAATSGPEQNDNNDVDNENDNVTGVDGTEVEQPGNEVVESEKPVEQNPNGVNFAGGSNVIDKTPAELSAESPEETARRFNINDEIPQDVADNPNVQVYAGDKNFQVPGGTHLHPDVAKDNYNRSLNNAGNSVSTSRTVSENVYATEAEQDDKGRKNVFDRDEDYGDDNEAGF